MDGEAGWWTTSANIGLPPLARAMGVGSQQHEEIWGPTEGASSMAVTALSTRPMTCALRMPSTLLAIRNANHR